jgi:hypothetical protein
MALVYPFAFPASPGIRDIAWDPITKVGASTSPYTGEQQIIVWPGQWWEGSFVLPPMRDPNAGIWESWLLGLNGMQGTFQLTPPERLTTRGTAAGAIQVGAGAVANSTVLPLQGGTGSYAVGDWLQVLTYLHRVTQVNVGSVDVFPRLRSAYAQTTPITYTNPKGQFRLNGNSMKWARDVAKFTAVQINFREDR